KATFAGAEGPGRPPLADPHGRRTDTGRRASGAVALHVDLADGIRAREAFDPGHEAEPPRFAAELAVGDHLKPEVLLPADHPRDRRVFRPCKEIPRAQQAADVLCPTGWHSA